MGELITKVIRPEVSVRHLHHLHERKRGASVIADAVFMQIRAEKNSDELVSGSGRVMGA
jgi:hypothetical protein